MSTAQYAQSRKYRLSPTRRLHILVAVVGLARAVSTQAAGVYFQNSYGLVSPSNIVRFSEFSPPPNTIITTQYQAYGVTFVPYVHYASIYNQTSGTPHIDSAACVANFVQYGPVVPIFSIAFDRPVSAAAFAVLSQPGTFEVTALWAGIEVPGGPHTFTGGFGPNSTNNFVGLSGVTFDELRIGNIATSDGALVLDNLQFTPVLVNSWTNPFSARWDSPTNWSLRTLPASDQTVKISNDGYKAVDIDGATVANFAVSLTVSNLLMSAPSNGLNTLLLNYAGLNTPLKVLNNCVIGTNGTIDNFSSSFEVDGNAGGQLLVGGGTFTQVGGLTVVNAPVLVRSGSLNATNGNLTLGNVTLGAGNSTGNFNQDGGSIAAQHLSLGSGTYTLASGILYAIDGTTLFNSAASTFHQAGGTNYGDISLSGGATYTLDSGLCQGNALSANGVSRFEQDGGVVSMQSLNITGPGFLTVDDAIGFYLRQGQAQCGTLNIGPDGLVEQDGGHFILTNDFALHGSGPYPAEAYFILVGGTLSSPSITLGPYAAFSQRGGSNAISGGLTLLDSQYYLPGGVLETTYIGVGTQAYFEQLRGSTYVHGVLSLSGTLDLLGGPMLVDGLYLRGTLNIGDNYQQADFHNYGLADLGGSLHAASFVLFGQVRLSTNALFDLASGSAQVRCQNSSGVPWAPGASLVVSNWHATGPNAVYFGTDFSGLSASQLRQIIFSNPGGFPSGNYPAQLLSTGELVPAPRPTLQSARSGSALVLTWSGNYQLLSATNINGPYTPVPGASSPWTNVFSKPQEFFKVQGL